MDQHYDAFTGGIVLGGMRTKGDIRVLLCYILKSLDAPFSKTGLNEVLQSTSLANFFEVNDAMSALLESGFIASEKREQEEYFTLTAAGREIADRLDTDLPKDVRKKAVASAMELLAKERAARGADAKIIRLEKGYHVQLTIREQDTVMMQTLLYAADSIQANAIADAFMNNPGGLYTGVINALNL